MKQIEYIVTCTYDDKKVFSKAYHGELIRCKDCIYFVEDIKYEGLRALSDMVCAVTGLPVCSTDYCSKGRRDMNLQPTCNQAERKEE